MRILATTALLASLVGCGDFSPAEPVAEPAPEEAYPGPWLADANSPAFGQIALALGRNSITGCGEFHYRFANGDLDSGEALVYCTRDGKNWTHYLVFYKINEVMRIKAEPGVPLPITALSPDR